MRFTIITCKSCGRKVNACILKQWRIERNHEGGKLISLLKILKHHTKLFTIELCPSTNIVFKSIGHYSYADGPMYEDYEDIGISRSEMRDIKEMARRNWS